MLVINKGKGTIQFPLIYVGHKNEYLVQKEPMIFSLIYVGYKKDNEEKMD